MTTLTIEIPDKVERTLADLVKQLGGKVVNVVPGTKQSKAVKKKQILDDLNASEKWVNLHHEGKIDAKTIEQLLDEL